MKIKINATNLSPLRYPGSKRRLVTYLYEILQHNGIQPNVLVEPFVGGGSVVLYFLKNKIVEKAIISDKDRLIYSFWYVLFSDTKYLINFIKNVKINLRNFQNYKTIAKRVEDYPEKILAEACIFLNRTSFSGIMTDSVGPLGGYKQTSDYKISCRFNKEKIIEKIKVISSFRRKVVVLPYDWKDTIEYAENWLLKRKRLNKAFFYFDPPFFNKACDLYRKYFSIEDHKRFCDFILSLKYDWVLSYDDAPEIRRMYKRNGNAPMHVEMPYSINSGGRRLEKELIITPLSLPRPASRPKG
ncbi:MAG: DNA adenine methylase [candidate division Zixibacteria bacterium]|nr:DNA adenine methylase [candidate division Zixibacteria bacterium]